MSASSAIRRVAGRVVVLEGDDIDTDRIMPARFLKAVTFEGIEQHLFADDRAAARREGRQHPLDRPDAAGAQLLVAGTNFGCGSSREHAPQALMRWGFRAVIAESFSPIFAGNALTIGLVCVTVAPQLLAMLMTAGMADPHASVDLDLEAQTIAVAGGATGSIGVSESHRHAWLTGEWDGTALLLDNYAEVERLEARLPYLRTVARNA